MPAAPRCIAHPGLAETTTIRSASSPAAARKAVIYRWGASFGRHGRRRSRDAWEGHLVPIGQRRQAALDVALHPIAQIAEDVRVLPTTQETEASIPAAAR